MMDLLERAREDRIAREDYVFDQGKIEGERKGRLEGERKGKLEGEFEAVIKFIKELKVSVTTAMQVTGLQNDLRDELITQLKNRNIPYTL